MSSRVGSFVFIGSVILMIFLCYICLRKKKKNRGVIFTTVQAVPGQQTTTTITGGNSTSVTVRPATAYIAQQSSYPTQSPPIMTGYPAAAPVARPVAPYPTGHMPMPQPMQMPQSMQVPQPMQMHPQAMPMPQPYHGVPQQHPGNFTSPPSYDQIMHEGYQRQAPFNPNYGEK